MNVMKFTLAATITLMLFSTTLAGGRSCPSCHKPCEKRTCELTPVSKTDKKHCYEVECKDICIPRVVLPWHSKHGKAGCNSCSKKGGSGKADCSHCESRCGKVRTVKVLKKVEYECKSCGWEWNEYKVGEKKAGGDLKKVPTAADPSPIDAQLRYADPDEEPASAPNPPVIAPTSATAPAASSTFEKFIQFFK